MALISRRTVLAGMAATGAAPLFARSGFAQTAEFNLKLATDAPTTHPLNVRLQEALDKIAEETDGRVKITLFPANQLGGSTDLISQVRSGALDLLSIPATVLSTLVSATAIPGIGFALSDYDKVWSAMDGDLGAYIRKQIEEARLVPMKNIFDNGFRQITTSTKPVNTAEDLNGMRIRVPVSPIYLSIFESLGAAPTSINFAELYSALQRNVVDAQENALPIIETGRIYEVQKYCSLTNHVWDGYWIVGNGRIVNGLPDDVRAVINKHIEEAAIRQREDILALSTSLQEKLTGEGMVFNTVETTSFREKLQASDFYNRWRKEFGDEGWAVLEKYSGALT